MSIMKDCIVCWCVSIQYPTSHHVMNHHIKKEKDHVPMVVWMRWSQYYLLINISRSCDDEFFWLINVLDPSYGICLNWNIMRYHDFLNNLIIAPLISIIKDCIDWCWFTLSNESSYKKWKGPCGHGGMNKVKWRLFANKYFL